MPVIFFIDVPFCNIIRDIRELYYIAQLFDFYRIVKDKYITEYSFLKFLI